MMLCIKYFVQNVYQACANIEISLTKNMIYKIKLWFELSFFLTISDKNNETVQHTEWWF